MGGRITYTTGLLRFAYIRRFGESMVIVASAAPRFFPFSEHEGHPAAAAQDRWRHDFRCTHSRGMRADCYRSTAPNSLAAAAISASRTPSTSSADSVRSAARITTFTATDLCPSPTWAPA